MNDRNNFLRFDGQVAIITGAGGGNAVLIYIIS